MSGRSFYLKKEIETKTLNRWCCYSADHAPHSKSTFRPPPTHVWSPRAVFMFCFVRFVFFGFLVELGVFSSLHFALEIHKQLCAHTYEFVKYHHHAITHTILAQSDIPAVAIKVALLFALKVIPMFSSVYKWKFYSPLVFFLRSRRVRRCLFCFFQPRDRWRQLRRMRKNYQQLWNLIIHSLDIVIIKWTTEPSPVYAKVLFFRRQINLLTLHGR